MKTRVCTIFIVAVATLACANHPTSPDAVPLGRAFDLRAGASATLESGVTVRFDGVRSDSRCPMDAFCVWAGDAVVALTLAGADPGAVVRDVHTDSNHSVITYGAYSIKLIALAPYPRSDRQIQPQDYVASLIVSN